MTDDVVNIYCNRGHPTKEAAIAAFMRTPGGRWSLQGPAEVDPRRRHSVRSLGRMVWVDQTESGPRRLPPSSRRSGDRRSYSLPCPLCGLKVDARDDRLQAILATHHAGAVAAGLVFVDDESPEHLRVSVSRFPLAVMAAIVNGS